MIMIYRRNLMDMFQACSDMENILLEILRQQPTKAEREFVRDLRAHMHDITELLKEQDY